MIEVIEENDARYVDVTETAKEIRRILKVKFPKTKFSVRSSRYSMGQDVTVDWTDGPAEHLVDQAINHLAGKHVDPVDDATRYTTTDTIEPNGEIVRHQHTAWIMTNRHYSPAYVEAVVKKAAKNLDVDPAKIKIDRGRVSGHAYIDAVHEPVETSSGEDAVKIIRDVLHKSSAEDVMTESQNAGRVEYILKEADRVFVPDTAVKNVENWAKRRGVVVRFKTANDPASHEIDMTPAAKQAFIRDFAPET